MTDTLYRPEMAAPLKIDWDPNCEESQINHLICDIDDVDKEKAIKLYKKVEERENKMPDPQGSKDSFNMKKDPMKKSSIIITPIDYYLPEDKISESSFTNSYYPKNVSKVAKKQPYRQQKEEYD